MTVQQQIRAVASSGGSLVSAAALCRDLGDTIDDCAPQLYANYSPTPSAQDLAGVLMAVWPVTEFADLVAALELCVDPETQQQAFDPTTAMAAAKWATTTPHDLWLRDSLADTGSIPYGGQTFQSPDIVPNPLDPADVYTQWNVDLGRNVNVPGDNTVYVRAWNAYPDAQKGQLYLYWALPSMLMTPSKWKGNVIPNANGSDHANLTAGVNAMATVDQPFAWTTKSTTESHYCLVARIVTEFQDNAIPPDDLNVFVAWVQDHPGVAWRNTQSVTVTGGGPVELEVGFGNPQSDPHTYVVQVVCDGAPAGAYMKAFTDPDPSVGDTMETDGGEAVLTLVTDLPPGWDGTLHVTVAPPPGGMLPASMTVRTSTFLHDPPTQVLAARAVPAADAGVDHPDVTAPVVFLGDYVFNLVTAPSAGPGGAAAATA